jgi:hypothetical protein
MIHFQLSDGNSVEIDRDQLEEKILGSILDKFEQARQRDSGMYTILKQAVNMVLTFSKLDIKIPKGENSLEYLVAYYMSLGLDALEKEPLSVTGKVGGKDDKER